ncbi:fumarylacetoacetate hydrolase family protein [Mycolicibacterium goodii]|uniref:5-oxopent-3-ene-1,2,5-tricarboxylate decarboxylase n=1 Tax=Mycolicibacterium goodii TaxID=134601 RepID=A0A0K0X2K3_MYCGD|nr:5-oxopent-3-ene-1,2,5-tricarboxylate decarboxylase [Mycolicibacterium goodii]
MRLVRFRTADGTPGFGVVDDVTERVARLDHRVPSFDVLLRRPVSPEPGDPRLPFDDISWEPPIGEHPKIICVGFNYAAHAAESGGRNTTETPEKPTLFLRFPDSLVGANTPVVRPADDESLDWEGEAALVIGTPGRRIDVRDAWAHIAGVTCMAENSVRTWQLHSPQATAGKNWHRSGAVGPWVTTSDEVGTAPLQVTTRVNGSIMQQDSTDRLTFPFAELVSYVSTFTPLRTGDVIATGTPKGIGFRMDPPTYLRPGDDVEVEVSRVGVLRHGVVDEIRSDEPQPANGATR